VALIRSATTTYPLIAGPPLAAGGAQRATALIGPPTKPDEAVKMRGALGALAGTTALERAENAPVPTAFLAWTWNLTAVPLAALTLRLVAAADAGRRAPT